MAYSPTTWVEKVTKVGPTNMNKLELGLQAAAAVADLALPTPAGSNGQFLKKVGGVWVPTSFATGDLAGLVDRTTLAAGFKQTVGTLAAGPPGSPTTNDIWIATDVDANGTCWMFRYNSAEATYKWEFIGGTPQRTVIPTDESTASAAFVNLATVGPSVTLARAGDYNLIGYANPYSPGSADAQIGTAVAGSTTNLDNSGGVLADSAGQSCVYSGQQLSVAAATTFKLIYASVNGVTAHFRSRSLSITPIRII